MKKIISILSAAALMLTFIMIPLNAGAADYGSAKLEDYAYQVAAIVNQEREAYGLAPLKYSDELSRAANVRAGEIQSYFSHTRPDGRSCFTAITDMGIKYRAVGENIAYGQRDPAEVMNAWMNSSGHRANILSENYDYIGIGVTSRNGVYYWSQFFAISDDLSGYVISGESPETQTTTKPAAITTTAVTTTKTITTHAAAAKTTTVTEAAVTTSANTDCVNIRSDVIKMILERFGIDITELLKLK